jgi:hypothetical protein
MKRKLGTKVTRDKLLVIGMVADVLRQHYSEEVLIWEGKVQGQGRFIPTALGHHMRTILERLQDIGEIHTSARFFTFVGFVVLSNGERHRFTANCSILEDEKRPRAAQVSLVVREGTLWYQFLHRNHGTPSVPIVSRTVHVDPLSPHLEQRNR